MDSEFIGRDIFGHINGKFNLVTEAEMSLFVEELKKLMITFNIVKIDICYCPDLSKIKRFDIPMREAI